MSSAESVPGDIVVTASEIHRRVATMGAELDAAYGGAALPLVLVCVLKGSLMFTADLARALTIPVVIDYIAVRSYGAGTETSGTVELIHDVRTALEGRDVLLVEDVIDSGYTTGFLLDHITARRPASVRLAVLFNKLAPRRREVDVHCRGFDIPDVFVVGYGLDHAERYRNLPDLHLLVDG